MNKQLFDALGLEFIEKSRRGKGGLKTQDIYITINNGGTRYKRYAVSVRGDLAKKLGAAVKVAVTKKIIYIVPSDDTENDFMLTRTNKNYRRTFFLSAKKVGNLDEFCGGHRLKFWGELDAYYISLDDDVSSDS